MFSTNSDVFSLLLNSFYGIKLAAFFINCSAMLLFGLFVKKHCYCNRHY